MLDLQLVIRDPGSAGHLMHNPEGIRIGRGIADKPPL
jgi:hypothetical protein